MTCQAEIHVGDIGTVYKVEVTDDDQPFDISTATVTQIIFKMPNGIVLRKDASVTTDGSPAAHWFLEYEVQPGDGIGSPGEFHDNEGPFQLQGFIAFVTGSQWHSNIQTMDVNGQELRIFPNLD